MSSHYYFKHGLRLVNTYKHEFLAYSKKRWLGQTLLDIYTKEFIAHTKSYYEQAIHDGRITVNNKRVSCEYKL